MKLLDYIVDMHMKKLLYFVVACVFASCDTKQEMTVVLENPLAVERVGEIVEMPAKEVLERFSLTDASRLVVLDERGVQVPCQVTYDDKLIFPVTVTDLGCVEYTIRQGTPTKVPVMTKGRLYPERLDDVAWENDRIGCRAYGPALQQSGQHGYGYDIFLKRGTTEPVLDELYHNDIVKKISYHVDHGKGMDCYAVGPTLGAGVSALMQGDSILYPWCYKEYEILDNGPLRFTVRLTFHPFSVGNDTAVVETRLISLDAGSQLNRTVITYDGLTQPTPIATGIVLHEPEGVAMVTGNAERGYISYIDPTQGTDNGKAMLGCLFPGGVDKAEARYFSPQEKAARAHADGHVLAIGDYRPGTEYLYYWGFAWDRAGHIGSPKEWDAYINEYMAKLHYPLVVSM